MGFSLRFHSNFLKLTKAANSVCFLMFNEPVLCDSFFKCQMAFVSRGEPTVRTGEGGDAKFHVCSPTIDFDMESQVLWSGLHLYVCVSGGGGGGWGILRMSKAVACIM